jgi:predicted TIM-barrel fold metal-dependent hydrolase
MIIDVNAFLGEWPFRKLSGDVNTLLRIMAKCKIDMALVSSLNAIFYKDCEEANVWLKRILQTSKSLIGICTINPYFPNSIENLHECINEMGMVGVKIHPNYHGYNLEDNSIIDQFFKECSKAKIPIIIPLRIQDERSHHPSSKIPPISASQIISAARKNSSLKIIVCNAKSNEVSQICMKMHEFNNLYIAFSWVQSLNFIEKMVKNVGSNKLLWGSNFPINYVEPMLRQVTESRIDEEDKEKILAENAKKIFSI